MINTTSFIDPLEEKGRKKMECRILLVIKRFTGQKQSFHVYRRMGRKMNFVVQHQDVIMFCRMDLMETRFGTNELGFQLPRKVVLLRT